jgi:WD40 repeat protein
MLRRFLIIICLGLVLLSGHLLAGSDELTAFDLRWSADGRWLGVGSSDGIWIFDAQNPDAAPLHYGSGEKVYVAAFDPMRPHVAFASEKKETVSVLDIETGDTIFEASVPRNTNDLSSVFFDLTYSDTGRTLSVINSTTLYTLDAETGEEIFAKSSWDVEYKVDLYQSLTSLDYSNNDTTVTASDFAGYLLTYNISQPQRPVIHEAPIENEEGFRYGGIERLELIPRSQRVVMLASGRLLIYSQDRGTASNITPLRTFNDWDGVERADQVYGFDLSGDSTQIAFGMSDTWFLYDLTQKTITQTFASPPLSPEDPANVYALAFNSQGDQVATLQWDGQFKVWDLSTGDILASWNVFDFGISQRWS